MKTYKITILLGGGIVDFEVIEASKYSVSSDGMVRFFNQQGDITHLYPSTRIYFTIEYDTFDIND